MFHDSITLSGLLVLFSFTTNSFVKILIYFRRPISVADFRCRVNDVNDVKRLIALCLQNLCFFFLNFNFGGGVRVGCAPGGLHTTDECLTFRHRASSI